MSDRELDRFAHMAAAHALIEALCDPDWPVTAEFVRKAYFHIWNEDREGMQALTVPAGPEGQQAIVWQLVERFRELAATFNQAADKPPATTH